MYTTPKTDNKVISSICILGGGTSGFVTAAILSEYFKNVKIKCVYSSSIGRIGVGESNPFFIIPAHTVCERPKLCLLYTSDAADE